MNHGTDHGLADERGSEARVVEAVRDVLALILSGGDSDEVLHLVASWARQLLSADLATIAVVVRPRGLLSIRAADGDHADELRGTTVPLEGSVTGDVLKKVAAVVLSDAASDNRIYQPVVRLGFGPAVFAPLVAEEGALGVMCVARRRGAGEFDEDNLDLAETFAYQAALAVTYAWAQQDLASLAVAGDRERIARDLHDGVIQSLFALGMRLSGISVASQEPKIARRIEEVVHSLDEIIAQIRKYIFLLKPTHISGEQVVASLRQLVADLEARGGISTEVYVDPRAAEAVAPRSPEMVQFIREALSNIGRHAGAHSCQLSLRHAKSGVVILKIADDGAGFSPEDARGEGQGLSNLEARCAAFGGQLEIESAPGRGTTLRVLIPELPDE